MSPRTGRRSGDVDTRGEILDAAGELFTAQGFDQTSMREVARAAGVDPALIHHYFDNKTALFAAALEFPFDPSDVLKALTRGPLVTLGERIVRLYLQVWEGPGGASMIAVFKSATTNEHAAAMLREFMTATLLKGIAAGLDVEQAELRASLCASQIVGVAVLRNIIGFQPLVRTDIDTLVAWLGPTLQRYLTAEGPVV